MIDMNEATSKIKMAGAGKVRSVPMPGQTVSGNYQIEILENGSWMPVAAGLPQSVAENIISAALNRLICG